MSNAARKARKRLREPYIPPEEKTGTPYLQRASTFAKSPRRVVRDLIDRGEEDSAKLYVAMIAEATDGARDEEPADDA